MTEHYGVFLDGLIVVLLLATIFYSVALSRRLGALRDNRKEMETAVRRFAEASMKADASIKGLKRTADESGLTVQKLVDRAQTLRDELAYLVEAAEAVAERLEAQTGVPRPQPRAASGRAAAPPAPTPQGAETPDRPEELTATRTPGRTGPPARPGAREDRDSQANAELLRAIENLR